MSAQPGQLPPQLFGGLWKGNVGATFLQGDARSGGFWFMAVGAHVAFGKGIPGICEPTVTANFVQLFVDRNGARAFQDAQDTRRAV